MPSGMSWVYLTAQMAYPGKQGGCRMEGCVLWRDHAGRHTAQPYYRAERECRRRAA